MSRITFTPAPGTTRPDLTFVIFPEKVRMIAPVVRDTCRTAIAGAFGVSRGHVSKILRGQTVASRKVA